MSKVFSAQELAALWNEKADQFNQWPHDLGLDEMLEFAQQKAIERARGQHQTAGDGEPADLSDDDLLNLYEESRPNPRQPMASAVRFGRLVIDECKRVEHGQ